MRRTPNYKLEYAEAGDFYSGASDWRRFVTLEYNLNTYIGFIGDGVIKGWELTAGATPLTVNISPGSGFVDGLLCESSWVTNPAGDEMGLPKRRSAIDPLTETIYNIFPAILILIQILIKPDFIQ